MSINCIDEYSVQFTSVAESCPTLCYCTAKKKSSLGWLSILIAMWTYSCWTPPQFLPPIPYPQQPYFYPVTVSLSLLCKFICIMFLDSHIRDAIQYFSFSVWLTSLSMTIFRSIMLLQVTLFHSFWWLSITLDICTTEG